MIDERDKGLILRMEDHCTRIADAISRFGSTFEKFESDADYKDVICMNLFQIGELSNQLTEGLKIENSDIPWDQMYGIRNILAHAYVKIDDKIIWETVQTDIPKLLSRLKEIV